MATDSITLAITGASGIQYGIRLLECLLRTKQQVHLLISSAARVVASTEMQLELPQRSEDLQRYFSTQFNSAPELLAVYNRDQWMAPIASGSSISRAMVICPCSSGTLAAIAHGLSSNLIERAADVSLKERQQLILVPRETPLSMIHLENMLTLTRAGATILPASPGFYQQPVSINDLVDFVVARILDQLHLAQTLLAPWGGLPESGSRD